MSSREHGADVAQMLEDFEHTYTQVTAQVARVLVGQRNVLDEVMTCLLAGGHALLEGVPGLGKTLLVRKLGEALDLTFGRIQFTPDLMPSDITGTQILDSSPTGPKSFKFEPGPIFANLVLADEVNRATPKTQSAILEAMQERTVSIAGTSHPLPEPFIVLATQNPLEMEGTYPLPEAQLDRFMLKIVVPPPSSSELVEILDRTTGSSEPEVNAVANARKIARMQQIVREVPAATAVKKFVADLVLNTHPTCPTAPPSIRKYVRYGASPRGAQSILLAAKVRALCKGRCNVSYDDVIKSSAPSLRHRLILSFEGQAQGVLPDSLIEDAIASAEHMRQESDA